MSGTAGCVEEDWHCWLCRGRLALLAQYRKIGRGKTDTAGSVKGCLALLAVIKEDWHCWLCRKKTCTVGFVEGRLALLVVIRTVTADCRGKTGIADCD